MIPARGRGGGAVPAVTASPGLPEDRRLDCAQLRPRRFSEMVRSPRCGGSICAAPPIYSQGSAGDCWHGKLISQPGVLFTLLLRSLHSRRNGSEWLRRALAPGQAADLGRGSRLRRRPSAQSARWARGQRRQKPGRENLGASAPWRSSVALWLDFPLQG